MDPILEFIQDSKPCVCSNPVFYPLDMNLAVDKAISVRSPSRILAHTDGEFFTGPAFIRIGEQNFDGSVAKHESFDGYLNVEITAFATEIARALGLPETTREK